MVPGAARTDAIALHKDHVDLVKFSSSDDHGFQVVVHQIDVMMEDAALKIKNNWDCEPMHSISLQFWEIFDLIYIQISIFWLLLTSTKMSFL